MPSMHGAMHTCTQHVCIGARTHARTQVCIYLMRSVAVALRTQLTAAEKDEVGPAWPGAGLSPADALT